MIITVNESGQVRSVPAQINQGTANVPIEIVAPAFKGSLCTITLKAPNATTTDTVICSIQSTADGQILWTAKMPKAIAKMAGTGTYQVSFYQPSYASVVNQNGTTTIVPSDERGLPFTSESGSFYVRKGVIADLPDTASQLSSRTLSEIYALLSEYSGKFEEVEGYADDALTSATDAESYAQTASNKAKEAKSYAIGGTGSRTGESTDNAKFYANEAYANYGKSVTYASNAEKAQEYAKSYAKGTGDTDKMNDIDRSGQATDNAEYYKKLAESYAKGGTSIRQGENSDNAKKYKELSEASATESKSYAVGGTNTRANENTDNAKAYSTNAYNMKELARQSKERAEEILTLVSETAGIVPKRIAFNYTESFLTWYDNNGSITVDNVTLKPSDLRIGDEIFFVEKSTDTKSVPDLWYTGTILESDSTAFWYNRPFTALETDIRALQKNVNDAKAYAQSASTDAQSAYNDAQSASTSATTASSKATEATTAATTATNIASQLATDQQTVITIGASLESAVESAESARDLAEEYAEQAEEAVASAVQADGYYPSLYAGNLTSDEGDSIEGTFVARTTANGENIADGKAQVKKLFGNSKRLNQLVEDGNFSDASKWVSTSNATSTISNNTIRLTPTKDTTDGSAGYLYKGRVLKNVADGNILLMKVKYYNKSENGFLRGMANSSIRTWKDKNTWKEEAFIFKYVESKNYPNIVIYFGNMTTSEYFELKDWQVVDITQLYNGNENIPSSIVEFNADGTIKSSSVDKFLELNPDYQSYVPYNQGSIEGVKPKQFKSIGKNLAIVNTQNKPINIGYVRMFTSRLLENGKKYTISFDASAITDNTVLAQLCSSTGTYLANLGQMPISNGHVSYTFTCGIDDVGCILCFGGQSNASAQAKAVDFENIQIEEGSVATSYEPYQSSSTSLPIAKYFPNGLHKIGDVQDEIDFVNKKAIQRVLAESISSSSCLITYEDYTSAYGFNVFFIRVMGSNNNSLVKYNSTSNIGYMEIDKYYTRYTAQKRNPISELSNNEYCIASDVQLTNWTTYVIRDDSITTADQLKAKAFTIFGELATPTETTISDSDIPALFDAYNQGHEEFIYESTDYPTEVPSEIFYRQNLKQDIMDMPTKYYNKTQVDTKVQELKNLIDDGSFDTFVGITEEKTPYYDFVGIKDNPKLKMHLLGQSLRNYVYLPSNFSITQNGVTLSYDATSQEFTANGTSTKTFNFFLPINFSLDDFAVGDELMFMRYYTSGTANLNNGYIGYLVLQGGNALTDGTGSIGTVSHRINENSESLYDSYISASASKKAVGNAQLIFQVYATGIEFTNFKFKLGLFAGNELQGFIKGGESATKSSINVYNTTTFNIETGSYHYASNYHGISCINGGNTFNGRDVTNINGTATDDFVIIIHDMASVLHTDNEKVYMSMSTNGECTIPSGKELQVKFRNYVQEGDYNESTWTSGDIGCTFSFNSSNINERQNQEFTNRWINANNSKRLYMFVPQGTVFTNFSFVPYVSTIAPSNEIVKYSKTLLKSYTLGKGETAELEFTGIPYGVLSIETSSDTLGIVYARSSSDGKRSYIEYDSQSTSPSQAISDIKQRLDYIDSPFFGKTIGIWGDSRESNNPDSNPSGGGDQKNTSWVSLLAQTLGCETLNYGVSGGCLAENTYQQASAQAIVNRIQTDDPNKTCDIIVISSMNDFKLATPLGTASITNLDATTYYGALNLTILRAQAKYPKKKILFVIPQKRFDESTNYGASHNSTGGSYAHYRQAQILVCQWHGIKYVDLYTEFPGFPKFANGVSGALSDAYKLYYLNDTHFSAVGNQFVADLVGRALASDSTAGTDFVALPPLPRASGTYKLTCTVDANMIPTFSWTV